jgi:serine/threonine protein kinase
MSLNHRHIIRLYDYFQSGSQLHLILEYCRGGSLSDEVNHTDGIDLPRFLEVSAEVAKALAHCHKNNIAFRAGTRKALGHAAEEAIEQNCRKDRRMMSALGR